MLADCSSARHCRHAVAARVRKQAHALVTAIRRRQHETSGVDALLREYDLSSGEGIVLMCLAEALLRIPDADTADRLIADKLGSADWQAHLGKSESLFVNASTWALLLTGRIVRPAEVAEERRRRSSRGSSGASASPSCARALRQAMRILGQQFVMGETIESALQRAADSPEFNYSFDMLGEAALTAADAERYFAAYRAAIEAVGAARGGAAIARRAERLRETLGAVPALRDRAKRARRARARRALMELALAAPKPASRSRSTPRKPTGSSCRWRSSRKPSATRVSSDYAASALPCRRIRSARCTCSIGSARLRARGRADPVRLVKGAYWDSEIKRAQEQGLDGYPVFTRKCNTDVSYLACAQALLASTDALSAVRDAQRAYGLVVARGRRAARFRASAAARHGRGALWRAGQRPVSHRCRVYAPVGSHEHLLPYLVRRLLENGANTSFVNRLVQAEAGVDAIVADPVDVARGLGAAARIRASRCRATCSRPDAGVGVEVSQDGEQPRMVAVRGARLAEDLPSLVEQLLGDVEAGFFERVLNRRGNLLLLGVTLARRARWAR